MSQTDTPAGAFIRDHRADLQWGLSWLQDSVNPQPPTAAAALAGAGVGGAVAGAAGSSKPLQGASSQFYQPSLMGLGAPGLLSSINTAAPKIQRQKSAPQTLDALRQWLAEPAVNTPAPSASKPVCVALLLTRVYRILTSSLPFA